MEPNKVASALRTIASKIDSSSNPKKELVAADIKRIVAGLQLSADPDVDAAINELVSMLCQKAGVSDCDEYVVEVGNAIKDVIDEFDFTEIS